MVKTNDNCCNKPLIGTFLHYLLQNITFWRNWYVGLFHLKTFTLNTVCLKVFFFLLYLSLPENKVRTTTLLDWVRVRLPSQLAYNIVFCFYVCYALWVSKIILYAFSASLYVMGFQVFWCALENKSLCESSLVHILMTTDGVGVFHLFPSVCVCVWGRNKDSSVSIPFCPVCWDPSVTVCVGGWVFWWFVKCLHASDLVQKPKLLSTSSVSPLNYWADYSQIGGEVLNHSRSRVRREQSDVVVYLRLCCICVCCDVNTRTQTHIRPLYPGFFPVSV